MLHYAALVLLTSLVSKSQAIEAPCGLSSMIETTAPTYLPLGRAARIQGVVVLMAEFGIDGAITSLQVVSGPVMLQSGAVDFVKGWRANQYTGPRTCPLVVAYVLGSDTQTLGLRSDPQHYTVTGSLPPCLCDPGAELRPKRKRFLIF
jgi:hypothetical protein